VGGAGRGGRGASRGVIRARVRLPTAFGEPWVGAAVNAALPARAPPAPLSPTNLAESDVEPLAKRRRTRSATSALPSGAQPVLVAPHEDPERILRSRPEATSVDAGKRWFAGHLRELGSSLTLVADGSSGADEFIARHLENDWRSVVKSIPRERSAEWNKALQLTLGWWKEAFDNLRRAEVEEPGAPARAAQARFEAAECLKLALPSLLLRKGASKSRAANELERYPMRHRIALFLAGDWKPLFEDRYAFMREDKDGRVARASGPSTPERDATPGSVPDGARARNRDAVRVRDRVHKQMLLGQYGRAFGALTPSRPAARTVETAARLQALHPRPTGWSGPELEVIDGVDETVDTFSIADLKKTIKSRPRGSAQDRWGWRVEFLAGLCVGAENRPTLAILRDYLQNMLNGGSSDAFAKVIGGARLAALEKNLHGETNREAVRPVGVTDLSRRLLGSTCGRKGNPTFAAGLSGGAGGRAHQLAVGRSRGTQTAFFGVAEYLRLHPERVVVIKDVENAFNTVSIKAADEGLKRLDAQDKFGMRRFLRVFYSRVDELSYFLDDGTRTKVFRYDGPTQGCPGSGLFYSAAVYGPTVEALEQVAREKVGKGDTVSLAYMDDDNLLGAPEEALRAARIQKDKFAEIGLRVRDYTILRGSEAPDAAVILARARWHGLDAADERGAGPRLKVVDAGIDTGASRPHGEAPDAARVVGEGFRVLGGPLGTSQYVPDYVEREVVAHQRALDALADFSKVHPHLGHQLTRYCADPRVHHLWMLVPRTAAGGAFEEAHKRILTLFHRAANLQLGGLPDTESNLVHSRLASPLAAGGFGLADPSILADAAWVASWVATAPWLKTVTGLDLVGRPRAVPQSAPNGEGPLWNAGRDAWNRVRVAVEDALQRLQDQRDVAEESTRRARSGTARAQMAARALKAANDAVESVRKVHDRVKGDFVTVTDPGKVWPARGFQRALSVVLAAANADAKIDEMLRGVEAGAGPAHTGTRNTGHEPTANVARGSAAGARARRDLEGADANPFATPPTSPLAGRRRTRDELSEDDEDGVTTDARAHEGGVTTRAQAQERAATSERASRERAAAESARRADAERARARQHAERAKAIIANALACRDGGMEWLNHMPCYGVPMLTAEEWTTAVHFSLGVDRPEFAALAGCKCACCPDKTHADAAAWTAHALNAKAGRHGMSPSGLHHRIAAVVNKIALECGVDSTLGGDRTRCGVDARGQGVFSDVFLADLYQDPRGRGVHLDVTCGTVVDGHGKSKGDHADTAHTINVALARKATQYEPFTRDGPGRIEVKVLAMNSGGRMSDDFHKVLYAFARRKVAKSLGVDGNDADGAAEDPDARTERKQRIAREKKRMIAAIQAARIAYQARLIMATTAQRERQRGQVGARGTTDTGPAA